MSSIFENLDAAIADFERLNDRYPEKIIMGREDRQYMDIQAIRLRQVMLADRNRPLETSYRNIPIEVRSDMNGWALAGLIDLDRP